MSDLTGPTRYVGFADRLECIDTLGVLLADLHDLSEGTFPNHFEQVESVDCERFVPSGLIGDGKMERSRA